MRAPSFATLRRSVSFQEKEEANTLPRTNSDLQRPSSFSRLSVSDSAIMGAKKLSSSSKERRRAMNVTASGTSHRRRSFEGKTTQVMLIVSFILWFALLGIHMNVRAREREAQMKVKWLEEAESALEVPQWIQNRHQNELRMIAADKHEDALAVKRRMVENPLAHFPEGHDGTGAWDETLRAETSSAFSTPHGSPAYACSAAARKRAVVRWDNEFSLATQDAAEQQRSNNRRGGGRRARAAAAAAAAKSKQQNVDDDDGLNLPPAERAFLSLKECGYVYLDSFFDVAFVDKLRYAFDQFRIRPDAEDFRYPCQGEGRIEYSLPFEAPFNATSSFIHDPRLIELVSHFLGPLFKLELATVINSTAGSGDQRWHQGWRYLFHPEEVLPPYALIVTIPLVDVTPAMGPTQVCAGHKLRFYRGYRCNDSDVQAAATRRGDVAILDYKLLHRGPANLDLNQHRPMISLVYSRSWMVNAEAYVNRGISLRQTINMRKWWESFYWHPDSRDEQFAV